MPVTRYPEGVECSIPYVQDAVVFTTNTAGNINYTAANLLGGLILRDANGAARADNLPTAAALFAALKGQATHRDDSPQVGASFVFYLRNTAAGAFAVTPTATAGVTISGTAAVAQNNTRIFLVVFTNVTPGAEAYTLYSIGTLVT